MENALRGVGIWDILVDEFIPDPALESEFWQPAVATAAEAAQQQPDSESEDEFVSDDGEESGDDNSNVEEDDDDNEHTQEPTTPVYNSPEHTAWYAGKF